MQVKHTLSGVRAVIDNQTERPANTEFPGDTVCRQQQMAQQWLVGLPGIGNLRDRFFRDYQYMYGRLGIHITKRQAQVIFINNVCRYLAFYNF